MTIISFYLQTLLIKVILYLAIFALLIPRWVYAVLAHSSMLHACQYLELVQCFANVSLSSSSLPPCGPRRWCLVKKCEPCQESVCSAWGKEPGLSSELLLYIHRYIDASMHRCIDLSISTHPACTRPSVPLSHPFILPCRRAMEQRAVARGRPSRATKNRTTRAHPDDDKRPRTGSIRESP
jgi:hypothetical protein